MKLSTLFVKNLIKLFYILNKTPLGEIECLSSLYYLLAVQASSFLIHLLSQIQLVRTPWYLTTH